MLGRRTDAGGHPAAIPLTPGYNWESLLGYSEDQSEVRLSHQYTCWKEVDISFPVRTCYESSPSRTQGPEVVASCTSRWEGTSLSSSLSEKQS